jgi:CheY-like chemotaxis protein
MPDGDSAGALRVLVVDDCRDHTDSLAFLLQYWGHDVRTAGDGPAGLAVARDYRPDVVLLDVGLPGMNGFEVARRLRQEDGLARTVVITISGYAQDIDRQHALEAGCTEHLAKPVDLDVLERLLAEHRQARARPGPGTQEEEGGSGP